VPVISRLMAIWSCITKSVCRAEQSRASTGWQRTSLLHVPWQENKDGSKTLSVSRPFYLALPASRLILIWNSTTWRREEKMAQASSEQTWPLSLPLASMKVNRDCISNPSMVKMLYNYDCERGGPFVLIASTLMVIWSWTTKCSLGEVNSEGFNKFSDLL